MKHEQTKHDRIGNKYKISYNKQIQKLNTERIQKLTGLGRNDNSVRNMQTTLILSMIYAQMEYASSATVIEAESFVILCSSFF